MGWYRAVHRKSLPSQEVRALLGARKQLQIKVIDLEKTVRGLRRAKVALARKLATVLHRMWTNGTEFVWGKDPAATVAA